MLTHHGIPPDYRGGVHLLKPPYAVGPVQSLSGPRNCVLMALTAESPPAQGQTAVLKVVPGDGYYLCITMDQLMCVSLFSYPLVGMKWAFRKMGSTNLISSSWLDKFDWLMNF